MAKGSKKQISGLSVSPVQTAMEPQGRIASPDGTGEIIVSRKVLELIEETAGVKNTPELAEALTKSEADISKKKTVSWDSVKEKLGL